MNEATTTTAVTEPKKDLLSTVNETSIKASMSIEMQRGKFEEIKQRVANLKYTTLPEDFQEVANVCADLKKLKDAIFDKHAADKKRYWDICKLYDKVKKDYTDMIDEILKKPESERIRLTKEIEEKTEADKREKARVDGIKEAISKNILYYTEKFTACESKEEFLKLQASVNLGRTRKNDFQEFLPDYIAELDKLNDLINKAKERVEKINSLKSIINSELADEDTKLEAEAKLQEAEDEREEVAVKALENSMNVSTQPITYYHASPDLPKAGSKRRNLKIKITDAAKAIKHYPELVEVSLNAQKSKELIESLKNEKKVSLDMTSEYEVNGISVFIEKVY